MCIFYFLGRAWGGGAGGLLEDQRVKVSVSGCGQMCFSCTCHARAHVTLMCLRLSSLL